MANSVLEQDSKALLRILNELVEAKHERSDSDSVSFKIFNCKDGYVIHHVPEDIKHPLRGIVNLVKNSYFLVSKLPMSNTSGHDESTEENDIENVDLGLALPVATQQHVFVGTPVSQKLYHLFQQKDLHSQETEVVEKFIDISCLEKLDLKYAKYFLSLYTHCRRIQKDLPEVWLLSDQNNHQGVTCMGMVPCAIPDSKKSDKSVQQVSTVLIKSENFDQSKKNGSSLSEQKKKHMVFNKASHAETHGYASYHIFGALQDLGRDSDRPESSITMEFAWDGVSKMLQPPPPSSNAVLNICAHPEDVRNILSTIAGELDSLVNHFTKVQKKLHETSNNLENEEYDRQELEKKVLAFLDDLKHNSFGTSEAVKTESVSASPTGNLAAPFGIGEALQRQDLDNTEYMWLFLKDFISDDKILFCFKIIFSALFEGEYHPILHATNQTQIAKLMKEVFCCQTNGEKAGVKAKMNSVFSTCAAVQCLVDIGLEKLRNDYTNYFVKQELVTKDKLDYYLAQDIPTAEKIQRLLKFHCIISLVALAISYAHITYDGLRKLVDAALKFYKKHGHTEHPMFSLSLPAFAASSSNIKNVCIRQFQPQTWMVAITTMNEYITIIQVEASDQGSGLESFVEQDKTFQNSYLATTATVSKVYI